MQQEGTQPHQIAAARSTGNSEAPKSAQNLTQTGSGEQLTIPGGGEQESRMALPPGLQSMMSNSNEGITVIQDGMRAISARPRFLVPQDSSSDSVTPQVFENKAHLQNVREKIHEITDDVAQQKDRIRDLEEQLRKSQRESEQLRKTNAELNQDNKKLHEDNKKLHEELTALKKRNQELEGELAELKEKYKELEEKYSDLDAKHTDLATKYSDLARSFRKMEAKEDRKNAALLNAQVYNNLINYCRLHFKPEGDAHTLEDFKSESTQWKVFMTRTGMSDDDIAAVDDMYKSCKYRRNNLAHPSCLFGEYECTHEDCQKSDKVLDFILKNHSFRKNDAECVKKCVEACGFVAAEVGKKLL